MADVERQPVEGALTRAATFIVLNVIEGHESCRAVRALCGDLASLVRGVGFRSAEADLSCVLGIGSALWDRLFVGDRPKGLHTFREIRGVHHAVSTPGDLLFHIRASRSDYCFELAANVMQRLGGAVSVQDETCGFKFFDRRDLLGFVDGTENPVGQPLTEAVIVGDEDPAFAGGSYAIVQKYIHDLAKWNAIPVEAQERILGRRKLSDIELLDAEKPSYAHNVLTSITENGRELKILRDNMPFGSAAHGEFGTYFIGYARAPDRIERMLSNMFVGDPPGNYDRLLDVSRAVTGSLFFAPPAGFLERLGDFVDERAPVDTLACVEDAPPPAPPGDSAGGSLGIGALKDGNRHE